MQHYILPALIDNLPDAVIMHDRTNDIIINNSSDAEVANEILKIAESCKVAGVNEVFISSILVKTIPSMIAIKRRVSDLLRDLFIRNNVHFIDSDNI